MNAYNIDYSKEKWEYIVFNELDYTGLYSVSNKGRVKSHKRTIIRNGNKTLIKERILKLSTKRGGYLSVTLRKNDKRKSFLVHRLVANFFIKKLSLDDVVHHNINPSLNSSEHLSVMSHRENMSIEKTQASGLPVGVRISSKNKNKFEALISFNYKQIYLGRYNTSYSASIAYNIAVKEIKNKGNVQQIIAAVDEYRVKDLRITKVRRVLKQKVKNDDFINYIKESRKDFCKVIAPYYSNIDIGTASDSFLIAFDQLLQQHINLKLAYNAQ